MPPERLGLNANGRDAYRHPRDEEQPAPDECADCRFGYLEGLPSDKDWTELLVRFADGYTLCAGCAEDKELTPCTGCEHPVERPKAHRDADGDYWHPACWGNDREELRNRGLARRDGAGNGVPERACESNAGYLPGAVASGQSTRTGRFRAGCPGRQPFISQPEVDALLGGLELLHGGREG